MEEILIVEIDVVEMDAAYLAGYLWLPWFFRLFKFFL